MSRSPKRSSRPEQGRLFDLPHKVDQPAPTPPTGPRPWDPIDRADEELGWQYRYITPARARQIAAEIRAR